MVVSEIQIPSEFAPLLEPNWREAAVYGGRGSLKSSTVARIYLIKASTRSGRCGCFREFQNSIKDSVHSLLAGIIEDYNLPNFKVTNDSIINTKTGYDFIFRGLRNNMQSIKSINGMTDAWVEEAQTVSEKSIEILTPTVREPGSQIVYTYNRLKEDDPVHKRLVKEGRPNTLIINVNYDVAIKYGWFPEELRVEMEDDKEFRPNLYKHKWLGEPETASGKIYTDWNIVDEIPHEASLVRRGLDFGYSVDPAAVVDVYYYNGGYILSERLYRRGMKNNDLGNFLNSLDNPSTTVMADSAEPKSIDEVRQYGVPIIPVQKKGTEGKSYLRYSIDYVQQQKISVTKASINLLDEYSNYYWATDKDGTALNQPEGGLDHLLDAARYAFDGLRPQTTAKQTSYGNRRALWSNR